MYSIENPMPPEEILDTALDAVCYFVKPHSITCSLPDYDGNTPEDLAMDAVISVLTSGVYPRTKTYVTEVARNTCRDSLRKRKLTYASPDTTEDTEDPRTVELEGISESLGNLRETLGPKERYALDYLTTGDNPENLSSRTLRRHSSDLFSKIQLSAGPLPGDNNE